MVSYCYSLKKKQIEPVKTWKGRSEPEIKAEFCSSPKIFDGCLLETKGKTLRIDIVHGYTKLTGEKYWW